MDESDDYDRPPKKPRRERQTLKNCIICGVSADAETLSSPKDLNSWQTLLNAAKIKCHENILQFQSCDDEIPSILYHIECRKVFVHKKSLEKIRSLAKSSEQSFESMKSIPQRTSTTSTVYDKVCIFCDKASKFSKNSKTREPLIQSVELRADQTIRRIAEQTSDAKMLAITSRELVAAEAHYHKSCYRQYTRVKETKKIESQEDDDELYWQRESEAYAKLFEHIRHNLFPNPHIVELTHLTKLLVNKLQQCGVQDIKTGTKTHIKRKLEAEFANSLEFVTDVNGRVLVMPSNLTREIMAVELMRLTKDAKQKTDDKNELITKSALILRDEIKGSKCDQDWPPDPDALDNDYVPLPKMVHLFIKTLLSGDKNKDESGKVHRVVNSISQDVVYAVTAGTWKPAKHILLPWAVKSLTGNVELIKILNRLGHGISYSQLEEIDTALCLKKMATADEPKAFIPSNIVPLVPVCLAYDNIDRIEETLSGSGTSHRVNGIVVQSKVPTAEPPERLVSAITKSKQRSIGHTSVQLQPYKAGVRHGPPPMTAEDVDIKDAVKDAHLKNLVSVIFFNTSVFHIFLCTLFK